MKLHGGTMNEQTKPTTRKRASWVEYTIPPTRGIVRREFVTKGQAKRFIRGLREVLGQNVAIKRSWTEGE